MFVVMIFGEWLLLVWPNFDHFQSQDFSRFGLCDDFMTYFIALFYTGMFLKSILVSALSLGQTIRKVIGGGGGTLGRTK